MQNSPFWTKSLGNIINSLQARTYTVQLMLGCGWPSTKHSKVTLDSGPANTFFCSSLRRAVGGAAGGKVSLRQMYIHVLFKFIKLKSKISLSSIVPQHNFQFDVTRTRRQLWATKWSFKYCQTPCPLFYLDVKEILTIDNNRDGEILRDGPSADLGPTLVCPSILSPHVFNNKCVVRQLIHMASLWSERGKGRDKE